MKKQLKSIEQKMNDVEERLNKTLNILLNSSFRVETINYNESRYIVIVSGKKGNLDRFYIGELQVVRDLISMPNKTFSEYISKRVNLLYTKFYVSNTDSKLNSSN